MEMDDRKIKILQTIINDYINTGEPVGSRTIAKKYDLGISPATIRNEMADLEEMGFLEQIHISSGRKPSDKGYRLYVDRLMKLHELTPAEELVIKENLINTALIEVDKILKSTSVLLSELTNLTCIVKTPSAKKSYIKAIQLLDIDCNSLLLVDVTDNGIVKNYLIRKVRPLDNEVLYKLNVAINSRLKNLTIQDIDLEVINNLKNDFREYEEIFSSIIPAIYDTLKSADINEVFTEGEMNILNYPEYSDIGRARGFLNFVNNKENIENILSFSENIKVSIGEENYMEGAKECSIITQVYTIDNKPVGTIGIIGPTRMHYSKVISILSKVIKELSDNLSQGYDDWGKGNKF